MINILFLPIIIPTLAGILELIVPQKFKGFKEGIAIIATALNLILTVLLFKQDFIFSIPWGGFGFEFSLRVYHFSSFIILAAACFAFLVSIYSSAFMRTNNFAKQFYSYFLITIAFVNGAVLADNLVVLLFFWEGLLLTLFGMIIIGQKNAYKTAIKAFLIVGITDLCLMFGIGLTYYLSGTMTISKISLPINYLGSIAFLFLMIGAISKSGAMPFHSWIPDASIDAPLPFMALVPASIEKLLGIYFLTRISLDIFKLAPSSWLSILLMIIGSITILFAVMMALIQKDYKRLLSYHAISQVGYMILGIGTAVPAGIIGGIFHMINNAMYKSCLFLTGGSVEKQVGTTDLNKLGGISAKMPVTFACFVITAAAISGVPPFNGFFSKELIYDGALERGLIFYLAAIVGSFLTAASFLKLGHAAFLDKSGNDKKDIKEAPLVMLVPMIVIALGCIVFGVYNSLPINIIQPVLGEHLIEGHIFSGFPKNTMLVIISVAALIGAYLNHIYGVKKSGKGSGASDHIHHAPVLSAIYSKAEKRFFDPYDIALKIVNIISKTAWYIDRTIDWFYDVFSVKLVYAFSSVISKLHNGSYATYILWSIAGLILIIVIFGY